MLTIQFTDSAKNDLNAGQEFYDSVELGLGSYFADSIISDIESLQIYAGVHSIHFGLYRMLAKRFPYAIYYQYKPAELCVKVIAILDTRFSPTRTEDKLKQ